MAPVLFLEPRLSREVRLVVAAPTSIASGSGADGVLSRVARVPAEELEEDKVDGV